VRKSFCSASARKRAAWGHRLERRPPRRTCKLHSSTRRHNRLSAILLVARHAMCKYFYIGRKGSDPGAHASPWTNSSPALAVPCNFRL
jgi:hypothetical protein